MEKSEFDARLNGYVQAIERLNGGAADRLDWDAIYQLLDDLTEGLPLILQPFRPSDKIGRGRKLVSPDKFDSIEFLAHPPVDKCNSYGRCNRPANPVLYAGVGTELVFSEIGARSGDYVGLLHMSPIQELYCVRLGALNLWRRTSGVCLMSEEIKLQISNLYKDPKNIVAFLLDAFISDQFSRVGDSSLYKLTSAYTSVVSNSNGRIAGLLYDSVDHTAGACFALKPDVFKNFMRPTEVQIVKVTNYLGYGIYDFEELAFANKFNGKEILWT